MPNSYETFYKDFFYKTNQFDNKPEYRKKSTNWRFDIHLYVKTGRKGPYWTAQVAQPTQTYMKKIILSSFLFSNKTRGEAIQSNDEVLIDHYNKINRLFEAGFEIYVVNKRGKLRSLSFEQWNHDDYLSDIFWNSQLLRKDLMENQLLGQGENIQHCHVLDHFELEKLRLGVNLQYDLNIHINKLPDKSFIEELKKCIPTEQLKKITIHYEKNIDDKKNFITPFDLKHFAAELKCSELKHISLWNIPSNKIIVPDKLETILLQECNNLREFPDFSSCASFNKISIKSCPRLTNLYTLPSTIGILMIQDCDQLLDSFKPTYFSRLYQLELSECSKLQEINLEKNFIISLRLNDCEKLSAVSLAPDTLVNLHISSCPILLENLPNLDAQPGIRKLTINNFNKNLHYKFSDKPLPQLAELHLRNINIPSDLHEYKNLEDVSLIANTPHDFSTMLPWVKTFHFEPCDDQPIEGSYCFPFSTESLSFTGQNFHTNAISVGNFFNLKSLHIADNSHLLAISSLPTSLIDLSLTNCNKMHFLGWDFPPNIKSINLSGCKNLSSLPNLENCHELEYLNLEGCNINNSDFKLSKQSRIHLVTQQGTIVNKNNYSDKTLEQPSLVKQADSEKKPDPISFPKETIPKRKPKKNKSKDKMDSHEEKKPYFDPVKPLKFSYSLYRRDNKDDKLTLIHPAHYRADVQDHIIWQQGEITSAYPIQYFWRRPSYPIKFNQTFPNNSLQKLTTHDYLVKLPLKVKAGQTVMLPTMLASDIITKISTPENYRISYDPYTNQHQIQFHADFDQVLTYIGSTPEIHPLQNKTNRLLPKTIRTQIDTLLSSNINLEQEDYQTFVKQIIAIKDAKYRKKLAFCRNELFHYCKNFKCVPYSDQTAGLPSVLRSFKERTGICSDRSKVYVMLCQYLGISARYINNDVHAYAELYGDTNWDRMDFGGLPIDVDFSEKQSTIDITTKKLHQPQPEKWLSYFSPQMLIDPKQFKTAENVIAWMCKPGKPLLLPLKDCDEARQIHAALAAYAKTQNTPISMFYLESEQDILDFISSEPIKNGEIQLPSAGPLAHFLEEEKGVLVINWERFTPTQIASYKSMLDTPPTLNGKQISPTLKIINLLTPKSHACSALRSRTYWFDWPAHINKPDLAYSLSLSESKDQEEDSCIDLYQDVYNWQTILLGDITLSTKGFEFIHGTLYDAIIHKKNVLLIDAPLDDPSFQSFMHRLLVERKCYINGCEVKVPPEFTVRFSAPKEKSLSTPKALYLVASDELKIDPDDCDLFYLHPRSVHELFKQYVIDKSQMKTESGWLNIKNKRKIIIETAPLTEGQKRQFFSAVNEIKDDTLIDWVVLKDQSIRPSFEKEQLNKAGGHIITTDDPALAKELLETKVDLTFAMNARTDASQWIEQIELKSAERNAVHFSYQTQAITDALIEGKTVLLYGTLSEELYHSLEPLFFSPARLKLANRIVPLDIPIGKLIVISTPVSFDMKLPQYNNRHSEINSETLWKEYETRLAKHPGFLRYFKKIRSFYQLAKTLNHGQVGTPPFLRINYERLWQMLDRLEKHPPDEDNPIKSLFHHDYDKDSENYLKLNIIAKVSFGNIDAKCAVRVDKLDTFPPTHEYYLQRLNCLNPAALKSLAVLDNEHLNDFLNKHKYVKIQKNPDPLVKIHRRMEEYIDNRNGVVLKGPAGTGKTFLALEYAKEKGSPHFFGEQDLARFLSSTPAPGKEHVLILDEANLNVPGTWDSLAPLFTHSLDETIKVTYNNTEYTINNQYKVIFTCNPESYPSRSYHPIIQDCPTVYVKAWTDESIKKNVLKQIKKSLTKEQELILDVIIKSYHVAKELLPHDELTIRDLQEVTRRWLYYMRPEVTDLKAAHGAILSEWQYRFNLPKNRDDFFDKIHDLFPSEPAELDLKRTLVLPKVLPPELYLSTKHRALLAQFQEDILLSRTAHHEKSDDGAPIIKSGLLLEGPSGIGKSTLMRELLIAMDYSPCTPETLLKTTETNLQNQFFQFTLSNNIQHDSKLLRAAFDKGCKVIIDELNLDPAIETLLNHLLTGKTPEGTLPQNPGFYALASQNSVTMGGRNTLSTALMNRLHVYYANENERQDLCEIAQQALAQYSDDERNDMVDAYLQQKSQYPNLVNSRTFFNGLEQIRNTPAIKKTPNFIAHKDMRNKNLMSNFTLSYFWPFKRPADTKKVTPEQIKKIRTI